MLEIEKFVRDPIYGFIGLTQSEIKLLATPFLQRLRRIKQLGNTHLVYPSACHSRFEHSLGVLHIANRMAQKLGLSDEQIRIIRYAALLHDVGHGPLSHNFEAVLKSNSRNITHEDVTKKIITDDQFISKTLGHDKQKVLDLFDVDNENFLTNYLSLDDIRFFDLILSQSIPEKNDYKLINCLENRILLKRGYEVNVKKLNISQKSRIIKLKPSYYAEIEEKLANKVGCDKDFVILYKQEIENKLYKSTYAYLKANETPIIVQDKNGVLYDLDEESLIHSEQEPLLKFYIFCPDEVKDKLKEIAEDILF